MLPYLINFFLNYIDLDCPAAAEESYEENDAPNHAKEHRGVEEAVPQEVKVFTKYICKGNISELTKGIMFFFKQILVEGKLNLCGIPARVVRTIFTTHFL